MLTLGDEYPLAVRKPAFKSEAVDPRTNWLRILELMRVLEVAATPDCACLYTGRGSDCASARVQSHVSGRMVVNVIESERQKLAVREHGGLLVVWLKLVQVNG
jgi:hypothetical protein